MIEMRNHVIEDLKRRIQKAGSQKAVADEMGISPSHLSDVLAGKRNLGEELLEQIGFVRITFFVKKDNAARAASILSAALGENAHFQKILDKVLEK